MLKTIRTQLDHTEQQAFWRFCTRALAYVALAMIIALALITAAIACVGWANPLFAPAIMLVSVALIGIAMAVCLYKADQLSRHAQALHELAIEREYLHHPTA